MRITKNTIYQTFIYLLALVSIPLAVTAQTNAVIIINWIIWGIFVADYLVNFILAKNRFDYIKTHVFELIAIIPFQMFTAARFLRLIRVFAFSSRLFSQFWDFMVRAHILTATIVVTATSIIGGTIFSVMEHKSILDSIYWAFSTITTIGYDLYPTSTITQIISSILVIVGIISIAYITAGIVGYSTEKDKR